MPCRSGPNPSLRLLGYLLTMFDKRLTVHLTYEAILREMYGELVFAATFPRAKDYIEAVAGRTPDQPLQAEVGRREVGEGRRRRAGIEAGGGRGLGRDATRGGLHERHRQVEGPARRQHPRVDERRPGRPARGVDPRRWRRARRQREVQGDGSRQGRPGDSRSTGSSPTPTSPARSSTSGLSTSWPRASSRGASSSRSGSGGRRRWDGGS